MVLVLKIRSWLSFLGVQTVSILAASSALAVFLFLIEYYFAYALQSFLVVTGIIKQSVIREPIPLDISQPWIVIFFLLVLVLVRGFVIAGLNVLRGSAEDGFRRNLRIRISEWAFDSEEPQSSEVVRRFYEVTNVASTAIMSVQIMLSNGVAILLVGSYLVLKVPELLAFLVLGSFLLLPISYYLDRGIRWRGRTIEAKWGVISKSLQRGLEGRRLLRIHGVIGSVANALHADLGSVHRVVMRYHLLASIKMVLPQTLGVAIVCIIAYVASQNMSIEAGTLVVAFYLLLRVVQMFSQSTSSSSRLFLYWPQLSLLHQWWDQVRIARVTKKRSMDAALPRGGLGFEFTEVRFSYDKKSDVRLDIARLTIPPGAMVAISGASGSGKSTLISLMLGLIVQEKGRVEILGEDGSRELLLNARDTLLARTAYAEAEAYLFPGAVLDNLCLGLKETPPPSEMAAVLKLAQIDFLGIEGLSYQLTDRGAGISVGQRQRIGLARALLRKPDLLVLDEATSNLDGATERKILAALQTMPSRPTIVLVSHRTNALEFADFVINVRDGMAIRANDERQNLQLSS